MALNIIVRNDQPVRLDKVREAMHRRENARRDYFNREGWKRLAKQGESISQAIGDRTDVMAFPRSLDGALMDNCREINGHSEWRRDKSYLSWLVKQPEMEWLSKRYGKQISRLISEAEGATLTPFRMIEKAEERRQADLSRLPAHYRQGADR